MDKKLDQEVKKYQTLTSKYYKREMNKKFKLCIIAIMPILALVRFFLYSQSPNR